ncbi:hypothetical protein LCGC14_2527530, partial [marine sediment metagenome]
MGGSSDDYGHGIAVDPSTGVYVTGRTRSSGWALGGFDTLHNGNYDIFVARIVDDALAVMGHVTYRDRNAATKDAAYVLVEVWENETLWPDYQIAEGYTDATGRFTFTHDLDGYRIVNKETGTGPFESGTRDIYFKIKTENDATLVKQVTGNTVPYTFTSTTVDDISGPVFSIYLHQASAPETPDHAAVMGIPGLVWEARQWLLDATASIGSWSRSQVHVVYPSLTGPEFVWLYDGIRIPEGYESLASLAHEYGHAVHYAAAEGSRPPGSGPSDHGSATESSPGFALIEGWADFLEGAVGGSSRYEDAVGTAFGYPSPYWLGDDVENVGNGPSNPNGNTGEVVEGAAAAILWDLYDTANDDAVDSRFDRVWTVFLNDDPTSIWNESGGGDFYHYWNARFGQSRAVDEIFIDQGIPVRDDLYDVVYQNDDSGHAAPLTARTAPYTGLICTNEDWYKVTTSGTSNSTSQIRIGFDHDRGQLELFVYD